jgi:hypothetical protein
MGASFPSWAGEHAPSTREARSPARPPRGRGVMAVVLTHGAGLAVHHKPVMACRVTPDALGQQADGRMEVQECGTRTRDVLAGSDGLSEAGVTHVAMARTGAYGQPVDTLLEGPCPVGLGNAAPVKHVPGRKTDRAEARWLAQLRRQGVRPASWIPPAEPRGQPGARRPGACPQQVGVGGVGYPGGVGAGHPGRVARGASRARDEGGVGHGAPAASAAGLGTGPARVGAGASPTRGGDAAGPS